MTSPAAAVCLYGAARADFLPPELERELDHLLPGWVEIPVDRAWNRDPELFRRLRPEILLTGWGAPRLPESRELMPSVKYVCHLAGSVRHLVPRRLIEEGLVVTNWGKTHAPTVAECALLLVLACLRRNTRSTLDMHVDKNWKGSQELRPQSLYGKRVGLHGFGAITKCLLPLLRPFGVSLLAYSKGVPAEVFAEAGVRQAASLEELFQNSDVLVELEAASPANIGTVTEAHLRSLPRDGVFVNVGRAAVVDEGALIRVALEGNLNIGLDVYHQEPLPVDSPLRGLAHVTLLCHQGGPTPDQQPICGRFALDNLSAYLRGKPLQGLVGLDDYDRAT